MANKRFTDLFIEKSAPPASGRAEYHDTHTPGLVLRVSPSGVKSFSFKYQRKNTLRRVTLGTYSGLSLAEARKRAWELRAAVQRGEDPVEEKKKEERERALNSFSSCLTEFIEKYAKPRNRTWWQKDQMLKRLVLPVFGDRAVKEITRRDM